MSTCNASTNTPANQFVIKLAFGSEIHRLRIELGAFSVTDLFQMFQRTFPHHLTYGNNTNFRIEYEDNEGDRVTVSSELEFMEACRVFQRLNAANEPTHKTMFFHAVLLRENLQAFADRMAPIVNAVEEFAASVSSATRELTKESKSREDFKNKCLSCAHETRDAIQHKAEETRAYFSEQSSQTKEVMGNLRVFMDQFIDDLNIQLDSLMDSSTYEEGKEVDNNEMEAREEAERTQRQLLEKQICRQLAQNIAREAADRAVEKAEAAAMLKAEKEAKRELARAAAQKATQIHLAAKKKQEQEKQAQEKQEQYAPQMRELRSILPHLSNEQARSLMKYARGDINIAMNAAIDQNM